MTSNIICGYWIDQYYCVCDILWLANKQFNVEGKLIKTEIMRHFCLCINYNVSQLLSVQSTKYIRKDC